MRITSGKAALSSLLSGVPIRSARSLDWTTFLKLSRHSALSPALYLATKNSHEVRLPDEIASSLKSDYMASAFSNAIKLEEFGGIAPALAKEDIDVILLKGIYLLHTVFRGREGARPIGDIDLLIRKECMTEAGRCLESLGYARLQAGRNSRTTAMYVKKHDTGIVFSIHLHEHIVSLSRLFLNVGWQAVDIDEIWRHAVFQVRDAKETNLYLMKDEHMLLSLCEHAFRHSFARMSLLYDIHVFFNSVWGRLDREAFIDAARRWSLDGPAYQALYLARTFFGTGVDDALFRALRPRGFGALERYVIGRIARNDFPEERECFMLYFMKNKTISDKARFMLACLRARFGNAAAAEGCA